MIKVLPCVIGAAAVLWSTPATAEFALPKDATVVFYGDMAVSPPNVGRYVESFVLLRYPDLHARFWHVGPAGRATSSAGASEFDTIVAPLKPEWIVLSFGSIDTAGKPYDPTDYDQYLKAMESMLVKGKAIGAKVAVLTPPRPEVERKKVLEGIKYDEIIRQYSEGAARLAKEHGALLLDWNTAMDAYVEEYSTPDSPVLLTKDGVQPEDEAVGLAVDLLLSAWKAEPLTASIDVDWAEGTVQSQNCTATLLVPRGKEHRLLELKDVPIPWPYIKRRNPFSDKVGLARFYQVTLTVANVPSARITLSAAGTGSTPVASERLAKGYNLCDGSPLADIEGTKTFYRALDQKYDAARSLAAWDRRTVQSPPPEPELNEAYRLHRQTWLAYIEGWSAVLARNTTTTDATIQLNP